MVASRFKGARLGSCVSWLHQQAARDSLQGLANKSARYLETIIGDLFALAGDIC